MEKKTLIALVLAAMTMVILIVAQVGPWWTIIQTQSTSSQTSSVQVDYYTSQAVSTTKSNNPTVITIYSFSNYEQRMNVPYSGIMMTMGAMNVLLLLLVIMILVICVLGMIIPAMKNRFTEYRVKLLMLILSVLIFATFIAFSIGLSASTNCPVLGSESRTIGQGQAQITFKYDYIPSIGWFGLLIASLFMFFAAYMFHYPAKGLGIQLVVQPTPVQPAQPAPQPVYAQPAPQPVYAPPPAPTPPPASVPPPTSPTLPPPPPPPPPRY